MELDIVKSPLNYTGGKAKLLPQIAPLLPKQISKFVDLFCGGCTVGLSIPNEETYLNDNNEYLISLYKHLQQTPLTETLEYIEGKIQELDLSKTNKESYLTLRTQYNKTKFPLDLFLLIAYSFNYQIRFNQKGEYNNPFGKDKSDFNPKMKEKLIKFINKVQNTNTIFTNLDFREYQKQVETTNLFTKDDFFYFDPPYIITDSPYSRRLNPWTEKEETDLLNFLSLLTLKGIKFAYSNVLFHKGKVNEILIDYITKENLNVHHLNHTYKNCNYQTSEKNGKSDEVFITNY